MNLEIKVEENISEAQLAAASVPKSQDVALHPPHPRDINAVLVKEERTLVLHEVQAAQGSRRMRWNVEPVSVENTSSPCKIQGPWLSSKAWMTHSHAAHTLY